MSFLSARVNTKREGRVHTNRIRILNSIMSSSNKNKNCMNVDEKSEEL